MKIFTENSGFSWRKAGTALIFFLFAYCVVGYCITHKWAEIPSAYELLIGMVFTFYFAKEGVRNFKLGNKYAGDPPDTPGSGKGAA